MFAAKTTAGLAADQSTRAKAHTSGDARVIQIPTASAKHFLMFGLLWQPVPTSDQSVISFIEAFEGTTNGCYLIQTTETKKQYGFIPQVSIGKNHLLAGGPALQQILGDSLALLAINPHCYLVLATESGLVLPDGEQVFESEQLALDRFVELSGQRKWSKRYADARFDLADVENADFQSLLSQIDLKAAPKFLALRTAFGWRQCLLSLVLFASGLGCLAYPVYDHQRTKKHLIADQAAAQRATLDRQMRFKQWKMKPLAISLAQQILDSSTQLPLEIAGWRLYQAEWTQEKMITYYRAQEGYTAEQFAGAVGHRTDEMKFMQNGKAVALTQKSAIKADGSINRDQEVLLDINLAQGKLLSLLQKRLADGKWVIKRPTDSPALLNFNLTSSYDPVELLTPLPQEGLELVAVTAEIGSGGQIRWKMNGNVYVQESTKK